MRHAKFFRFFHLARHQLVCPLFPPGSWNESKNAWFWGFGNAGHLVGNLVGQLSGHAWGKHSGADHMLSGHSCARIFCEYSCACILCLYSCARSIQEYVGLRFASVCRCVRLCVCACIGACACVLVIACMHAKSLNRAHAYGRVRADACVLLLLPLLLRCARCVLDEMRALRA